MTKCISEISSLFVCYVLQQAWFLAFSKVKCLAGKLKLGAIPVKSLEAMNGYMKWL